MSADNGGGANVIPLFRAGRADDEERDIMKPHAFHFDGRNLSTFVRSRRERIRPADVGLESDSRRRTPGLRREEVANLAGVGLTWYTWFEQGRDIQVSNAFLENLARALRLTPAERMHLFHLAKGQGEPLAVDTSSDVSSTLSRLVRGLPGPGYVRNARWDVLAWNDACAAVFFDFGSLPIENRNIVWLVFAEPHFRRILANWESDCRRILARFRADYGASNKDGAFLRLVERLKANSDAFRGWWPEYDVRSYAESTKHVVHPLVGDLKFDNSFFSVDGKPGLNLIVHTPQSKDDETKVEDLVLHYRQRSPGKLK